MECSARARSTRPKPGGLFILFPRLLYRVINCWRQWWSIWGERARATQSEAHAPSDGGAAQIKGLPTLGRKTQRHRDRGKTDRKGTGVEPSVAMEGIEHITPRPWPQCHAQ